MGGSSRCSEAPVVVEEMKATSKFVAVVAKLVEELMTAEDLEAYLDNGRTHK